MFYATSMWMSRGQSSAGAVVGQRRRIRYRVVIHGEWLIHFIRIFIGF
jgi:hypothetical protein